MIASELQSRIFRIRNETDQNYQRALGELREMKMTINELEQVIVDNSDARTSGDKERLDSAMDKLIRFTDFMISESERIWEEYRKLERECGIDTAESSDVNAQMKALRELCEKTDEFATDLLCYSLAHFKRKDA